MTSPAIAAAPLGSALLALAISLAPAGAGAAVDVVSPGRFVIDVDGFDLEIPYESSHPLDVPDTLIDRVVIVVHGIGRNSEDYYARVQAAAGSLPGVSGRTLIIAPQFLIEEDIDFWTLPATTLFWSGGWREGNKSKDTVTNPRPARISSYAVVDAMIDTVANPAVFPNLAWVVLTGHSAGGQFANRFAAGSASESTHAGLTFRYVVANPSSYVYFTPERRVSGSPGDFAVPSAAEIAACPDYDEYKYGLQYLNAYMSAVGPTLLTQNYGAREVQYLLGELDTGTGKLDVTCPAVFQGVHRLERGIIYFDYIQHVFGPAILALHEERIVPGVGHGSTGIYQAPIGKDALFGPIPNVPAVPTWGLVALGVLLVGLAWSPVFGLVSRSSVPQRRDLGEV